MASFPVFTPTGPNVDVRLFGEAATQGAALGKAIPSPLTSIIQGATEGYKTGLDFAREEAVTAQVQQQTENEKTRNEIDKLRLDNERELNDLTLQANKAKLTQSIDQAQQADSDIKTRNQISDRLASGDPQKIAEIYSDPTLNGYLLRDKNFADEVGGRIYGNQSLPQDVQQKALSTLALSQQLKFKQDSDRLQAQKDRLAASGYEKAVAGFNHAPITKSLLNGIPEDQLPHRVRVIPAESGSYNKDGTLNESVPFDTTKATTNPADKGYVDLLVDNKFRSRIPISEATALQNLQDAVSAQQRNLGRDAGIHYQGRDYSNGTATPTATPPVTSGTPSIPTFISKQEIDESQKYTPLAGDNANIVPQYQTKFQEQTQNAPPGMSGTALLQRRALAKQRVNSFIGPSPSALLNSATSTAEQTGVVSTSQEPPVPQKRTAFIQPQMGGVNSPHDVLSGVFKQDVTFNVEPPQSLDLKQVDKVINRVYADPLTKNESPVIQGLVAVESGGRREAVSGTGVRGLVQVTKAVADSYGLNRNIPEQNLLAGKLYLGSLMNQFGGNLRLSLAAYNAGPGKIRDAIRETGSTDWGDIRGYLQENLSAKKFKEVKDYPDKVLHYATQFMAAGGDGTQGLAALYERNGLVTKAPRSQQESDFVNT